MEGERATECPVVSPPTTENGATLPVTTKLNIDSEHLKNVFLMHNQELRDKIARLMETDLFSPEFDLNLEQLREVTHRRALELVKHRIFSVYDLQRDPLRFIAAFESITTMFYDGPNVGVKIAVQFTLFGGTILSLGTERHNKYLPLVDSMELMGCFALTELGHGSNARGIETTATYDKRTQEYIINTPTDSAQKFWIGGAAVYAQMAVVFAQLYVEGVNKGVHAFLVPIRDKNAGNLLPNVRILDCGHKEGLNGIDNGRMWFNDVRIPRENLLNRFAEVHPDGTYESPIDSPNKRFIATIGELVTGRIILATACVVGARTLHRFVLQHAFQRLQFGPSQKVPEVPLITYRTHKRRLLPYMAADIALTFACNHLKRLYVSEKKSQRVHVLASGLKSMVSWHLIDATQLARECLGGLGYGKDNMLAHLKPEIDIYTTFEGDNTVLLQQVSQHLLSRFQEKFSGGALKSLGSVIKYLRQETNVLIFEKNPLTIRNAEEKHLRDPKFIIQALHFRQAVYLRALATKLRNAYNLVKHKGSDEIKAGIFACWARSLDMVLDLAKAHCEAVVMEQFVEGINKDFSADHHADTKKLLEQCCCLYGLWCLERGMAFYLCQEYVTPVKARAIKYQVDKLCEEITPNVLALLDGFGIPDTSPDNLNVPPVGKKNFMEHYRYDQSVRVIELQKQRSCKANL